MCHLFLIHQVAAANTKFIPDNQSIADCEVLIPKWVRCDSLTGSRWILIQHSFMQRRKNLLEWQQQSRIHQKKFLKVDSVAIDPGSDVGCASAVTLAGRLLQRRLGERRHWQWS